MKHIDRYILSHFIRTLSLTLTTCISIYLLVDFLEKMGRFIKYKAVAGQYLTYILSNTPIILLQVTPLAILMSVVLTLGGLGRSNEITAMRAGGLSLWRIFRPIFQAVAVVTLGYLLVNEFIAPFSARQLSLLVDYQLRGRPEPNLSSDHIWYRDGDRIINVALVHPQAQKLEGVRIFTLDERFKLVKRQEFKEVSTGKKGWMADGGEERRFDPQTGDLVQTSNLLPQTLNMGRKLQDFALGAEQGKFKDSRELWRKIHKLKQQGINTSHLVVDLQARLAAPFACLVMAILGAPFSLTKGREKSIAVGIGISLAIGVSYFLLFSISLALGYSGALPAMVAGWAPNILFFLLAVYLLLNTHE